MADKDLSRFGGDRQDREGLIQYLAPALRGALGCREKAVLIQVDDSAETATLAAQAIRKGPERKVFGDWPVPVCVSWNEGETARELAKRATDELREREVPPRCFVAGGLGLFVAAHDVVTARQLLEYGKKALRAWADGQDAPKEPPQAKASTGCREGRVAGKVALVTGAAQGFGLGIAELLVAQGAWVALADINLQGAQEAARDLEARFGEGAAVAVEVNITDSESIQRAAGVVARTYGGLDILISNAGVLKAESVKSQPEKDFDFVTSVNYRGYFLTVKYLCGLMAAQHDADPKWRG
ncbi:SDR family NAD(P)-dependent oxidoreductase, partial [bacterium]|nr:SDR family NAD(P)-dependent oxidoreductase [bacterium]